MIQLSNDLNKGNTTARQVIKEDFLSMSMLMKRSMVLFAPKKSCARAFTKSEMDQCHRGTSAQNISLY